MPANAFAVISRQEAVPHDPGRVPTQNNVLDEVLDDVVGAAELGADGAVALEPAFDGASPAVGVVTDVDADIGAFTSSDERLDHFIHRDGEVFAGTHLIVDLFDAQGLDDLDRMERALREATQAAGATLLHVHLHHFTPNGGISGVAVLAESHISVHSWPERGYAAFDIFMCGDARPERGVDVLVELFEPQRHDVIEHRRGRQELQQDLEQNRPQDLADHGR